MISVAILTKNNENTIERTLNSIRCFNEIIILDNGSTDKTLEIAEKYENVKIHKTEFTSFGELRNVAAKISKNNWILALDSDEEVSDDLFTEINQTDLNINSLYSIPFHNYYNNIFIKSCGWYPEFHIRLYNKEITSFNNSLIHEGIIKKNLKIEKFKKPIFHYSYNSIDDFLIKMQKYTSLFAIENHKKKKSSIYKAVTHGLFSFFKCYILKRGIFQGREGLIISMYNANTAFYKYLKLEEINNKPQE